MDLVPVVIISKQQGIPIPSNEFTFSLSKEEFETFRTAEIDIRGAPLKDAFLISISNEDQLALNLLLNAEEKLNSTALIGVFAQIGEVVEEPFEVKVTCRVLARAKIDKFVKEQGVIKAPLLIVREKLLPGEEDLLTDLRVLVNHLISNETSLSPEIKQRIQNTKDIIKVSNILANELSITIEEKFDYLQYKDNLDRFTLVLRHLIKVLEKGKGRAPHDSLLPSLPPSFTALFQQQLEQQQAEQEEYDFSDLPLKVKQKLEKEEKRLRSIPPQSMEHQAVADYIDWVTSLPWGTTSYKSPELNKFLDILDESHYGLEEVKEHILEYMTIESLTGASKGSVMCFLGPPGTGKTSIAKQIAKATNREVVKIALGGMSDEAEIRGHRRTYVAAKPGRIITGLTEAKTMDPLFLLDEIDKIGEYRGDPISALLELLDPEQNDEFIDRFIECPVDMSKAMFVCTANYKEGIPDPLRDRLETIKFREYTYEEKTEIAKRFLVPKALKDYGLQDMDIQIDFDCIKEITKEKGVREIERRIRKLLRQAAVKIVVKSQPKVLITKDDYLKTFENERSEKLGFS